MLLIPAIHETGETCVFDADQVFVVLDTKNGTCVVQTAAGLGLTLRQSFDDTISDIHKAIAERKNNGE